jgi:cyclohexanone monooxygenase
MGENNDTRIVATTEAEDDWTDHVNEVAADTLLLHTDSWFVGANIPGKKRTFLMYAGGSPAYREKCEDVAAKGYEGFTLSQETRPEP